MHGHDGHRRTHPPLVGLQRWQFRRAGTAPVGPQVEHHRPAGQRTGHLDRGTVAGTFDDDTAQFRRARTAAVGRTRRQVSTAARSGKRLGGVGVTMGARGLLGRTLNRGSGALSELQGQGHHQCRDDGKHRQRPAGRGAHRPWAHRPWAHRPCVHRPCAHRPYNPTRASRCSVSGPLTSSAAMSRSVGPSP